MNERVSKDEAKRSVLKTTVQQPLTIYSVGLGIVGTVGAVLFGGWIFPAVSAGGFLVGGGTWVYNYFGRRDRYLNEYYKKLQEEFERKNKELSGNIKNVFTDPKVVKCSGSYAKQGLQQFDKLQENFEAFTRILNQKLNPGEVTYRRFMGLAEQIYFSVLDNLQNIATLLQSACGIDADYIDERVQSLNKQKKRDSADEEELKTLHQRREIQENQFNEVNALLTQNEQAMTQLAKTTSKLASIQTAQGRATGPLEDTMKELEDLADRADRYSVS